MAKNKEDRKIYRDFTMQEFDEFTLEVQSEGAHYFKNMVLAELERRRGQIFELLCATPINSKEAKNLKGIIAGLEVASGYVENMGDYKDLDACPECGSL